MKACRKCGVFRHADAFNKRTDAKDGLSSWCRACEKARKDATRTPLFTSDEERNRAKTRRANLAITFPDGTNAIFDFRHQAVTEVWFTGEQPAWRPTIDLDKAPPPPPRAR